ncbi:MAG TPA: cation:proton antiporter [Hydrogenothermaceae bacterium]|nr:cation:proton antiporter [Hydrogenothermaceae bacterium]
MHNEFHLPFLLLFGIVSIILFISGYIGKLIRFPTIIFFIFAGLVLGNIVHQEEVIEKFSEIGIVLLFFYLGLEFNFKRAIETGKKIWIVGFLDFLFGFVVIFFTMKILGFDFYSALLAGGIAYASSSAITTKIIIDNHRIANPETELILGLMVFEDIVAPVLLAIISSFSRGNNFSFMEINLIFLKIFAVFIIIWLISHFLKDKLNKFIDSFIGEDIFILFAFGIVVLASGFTQYIGLSEALGAFLVGVLMAEAGKEEEIEKALYSIKDLAVALFFMFFGASIQFSSVSFDSKLLTALILIIVLSIIGKFLTGYLGGILTGLSKKASIVVGFSIINRGEFSIVMSKFAKPEYVPLVGIYVLVMASIGIIFAQFAPKLAQLIFPKKSKKKKKKKKISKPEYV